MTEKKDELSKRAELEELEDHTNVTEKTPDDMCFEGGNCEATGHAQAIVGDLRSLVAKDSPDDFDENP